MAIDSIVNLFETAPLFLAISDPPRLGVTAFAIDRRGRNPPSPAGEPPPVAPRADDPSVTTWEFLNTDRWTMPKTEKSHAVAVTVPLRRIPKYELMLPQIAEMADAGSGVDLISRALGVSADVVRDALHLHRTGEQPPARIDGRRQRKRAAGPPPVPKYQQLAPEVDRRRKAGEGFDRLARELDVSRGTILRAYDFANRDEAIAAAKEGRKPTRPSYTWSEQSRAARQKARSV